MRTDGQADGRRTRRRIATSARAARELRRPLRLGDRARRRRGVAADGARVVARKLLVESAATSPRRCVSRMTIRPATGSDVDLLVAWHRDPEVARYWDDETYTREEMEARLTRADVEAFVVEEADTPVGYIDAWTDDGRS